MIICSCNVVSDDEVREAVGSNCRPQTPGAVYRCLGCSPSCGRCLKTVKAILSESLAQAEAKADNCPVKDRELRLVRIAQKLPDFCG